MAKYVAYLFALATFAKGILCGKNDKNYGFECKPKPGCNLGSCIDIPMALRLLSGFDEYFYREENDYHLECRSKNKPNAKGAEFISKDEFNTFKDKVMKDVKALNKKFKELKKAMDVGQSLTKNCTQINDPIKRTETQTATATTTTNAGCCEGVFYKRKCFILVEGLPYAREHFEGLCNQNGMHLANIYSLNHYYMLAAYVREKVGLKSGSAQVHLGMNYRFKAGGPQFYDGTAAEYDIPWVSGYPKNSDEANPMLMYVDMNPAAQFQGIYNFKSSNPQSRAMCEM